MTTPTLFTPTRLGAIEVKNRIAMAPLTRSRAGMDGVQTPLAATYYAQRASAGLLIAEATNISRQGRGYAYTPGIYTDAHVAAWRPVTDAVHAAGGKIVLQLWHVGRMSHVGLQEGGAAPVAPSAIPAGGSVFTEQGFEPPSMPRALRTDEIPALIEDYRQAALRAQAAGFDGVEVHAANGYLLEQFLRDSTNQRTDAYGGSIENRARLTLEVVAAVAGVWGADRVGVRLSPLSTAIGDTPLDSTPMQTHGYLVAKLSAMGVAYLHVMEGQMHGGNGADAFDIRALRAAFAGAYIANNGYERQTALDATAQGRADLVAFGRAFIGNPDLVARLRHNRPLFDAPQSSYFGGGADGYTDFTQPQAA
ncbi:N-ethylmaleimide reductase [Pelomonas saccharophila]|uniref:N-ethylmaleimide reductase n=1 Tax=Roseateles saccharophilus TaxID=304 RepID=A0ABU1YRE5_ROSSA|nr:alkene reductase [Roseateles saccharophilus]MDR7270800.1 N-ethylmaleimide reductase [Roseateles saccharophilus]